MDCALVTGHCQPVWAVALGEGDAVYACGIRSPPQLLQGRGENSLSSLIGAKEPTGSTFLLDGHNMVTAT